MSVSGRIFLPAVHSPRLPCLVPSQTIMLEISALGDEGYRIAETVALHDSFGFLPGSWFAGPPPRQPARGTSTARTGRGYLSECGLQAFSLLWLRPWE